MLPGSNQRLDQFNGTLQLIATSPNQCPAEVQNGKSAGKRERKKGRYTGKKQSKRGEELQSKEIGKINVMHKILDKEENRK